MKPTKPKQETDRIAEKRWEDEGGAPPDRPPASESEIAAAAERVHEHAGDTSGKKNRPRRGKR